MLTISKPISAGQAQRYHREEFANARENYYTRDETVRGEWHGRLADEWGLRGEVDEEQFTRLAEGQHPLTGEQLVRQRQAREYMGGGGETVRTMEHRAGWDATFSAPKPVSLTALVGGDERVIEAHRQSVGVAIDELERFADARIGGNAPAVRTGRWVAARFEHDASRPVAGYAAPQLHTHVVVFNMTRLPDGQTRALQPRELYRAQRYATAVYRSELAARLKGLGYGVERGRSGEPEIKGYTREYVEASSPRRRQIERHLEEAGLRGAGPSQIAAHQTRESKLDLSREEVLTRHRELAKAHGDQPARVVEEARARQLGRVNVEERARAAETALSYSRARNLERAAVVDERSLLTDALNRSHGQARLPELRAELERRVAAGQLLETQTSTGRAFTTREMVAHERENLDLVRVGQGRQPELAGEQARRAVLQEHAHLNAGQRAAVEQVLQNRDRVMALEGVAGAGKTTSLAAIRRGAEHSGYEVQGLAPTSRATQKLEESGIRSVTLQRHLARGAEEQRAAARFYVVDESSLASTKQMNELFKRLHERDRVLLVGDTRQHQAVEAGRPYQQLQESGMQTARLDQIVRQKDQELRRAVEHLSRGQVREAFEQLDRQGRVHEIPQREARLKRIAREYAKEPHGTLVVSPDNQSRREINELIRRELQAAGRVEAKSHRVKVLEARPELAGADRAWAGQYQRDDVVRYAKGSKQHGIEKGEYARVVRVNEKENRITVARENGARVSYDPRRLQGVAVYRQAEREIARGERVQFTAPSRELRVANREQGVVEKVGKDGELRLKMDSGRTVSFNAKQHPHLDHGYAVTSHSGQGQTADRVLVHAESKRGEHLVNNRLAYVSVSRGRLDAQVYTDSKAAAVKALGREVTKATALEVAPKAAVAVAAKAVSHTTTLGLGIAKAAVSKVVQHISRAGREID